MRRQLTLFVDPKDAINIEQIRNEFNPRQFEIIKAHVTLCREDEIQDLERVMTNLLSCTQVYHSIFIEFGPMERFDNGKGLLLPATKDCQDFITLRKQVLSGLTDNPRDQKPHITLMHPRNSTCNDHIFQQIGKVALPTKLVFQQISLIEQQVDGGPWKTLKIFTFNN
ncbi:MAG: 2'-5' RNA ligase family protein [Saprospiraceae bacterium]|nr:2'-5' RNA ligase family protein [Saprospiraceae bacterium]MBP7305623.1 2'-5' RNA ligase family protein [Saprospiraceae bacterium]